LQLLCIAHAQADGTLAHVVEDPAVLTSMLQPINGLEPKEKDDLVRMPSSTVDGRESAALESASCDQLGDPEACKAPMLCALL